MIGEFVRITFTDRKEAISGVVIDLSDDWLLMHYNYVHFEMDGYVLIKAKNLKKARYEKNERFKERVLQLKGFEPGQNPGVPLTNLAEILRYLTDNYGVFSFETKSENACYLGRLIEINSRNLTINFLDTNAKWKGPMKFRPGDVRVIYFDTDYINSLKLAVKK